MLGRTPASPLHTVSHSCSSCSWSQCGVLLPSHRRQLQVSPLLLHHCQQPVRTWSLAASLLQEITPSTAPIPSREPLSKEQLAAVESMDTCIRVVAGPGSGKTRVLTHRVVHLISNCGVPAHEILFITFTNKAAQEIRERLEKIFGSELARDMMVGTFHSLCAKILRWKLCSGAHNNFAIYDEEDSLRVVRSILIAAQDACSQEDYGLMTSGSKAEGNYSDLVLDLKTLGFLTNGSSEKRLLRKCLASKENSVQRDKGKAASVPSATIKKLLDSIRRSRLHKLTCFLAERKNLNVPQLPKGLQEEELKFATLYENALRRNNALDFDDLIQLVVQLLHNNGYVRELCQKRWKYILVDEFQDTDMVQYELIRLLASENQNLFIVGDIDQAIYGWRGAEIKHMQKSLEEDFPAIRTFQLGENYRSSSYIVKAASVVLSFSRYDRRIGSLRSLSLVPAVKERKAAPIGIGEFNDQTSEANFVVSEILNLVSKRKANWGSFALLYRTRVQALQLGPALSRAKIPYSIVGITPFYADKEVKTLLAYLQYVSNPDNAFALDYCLNKPSRGIGNKTIEKVKGWAGNNKLSFPQALEKIFVESMTFKQLGIRSNGRDGIMNFMELIRDLRELSSKISIAQLTRTLIYKLNFEDHLLKVTKDEEEFRRHMERLQQLSVAAENAQALYGVGDKALCSFLEDITLVASNEETPGGDTAGVNEVKLLTLHASKGLEFDVVFLVGARDDLLPLEDADDEEERRLFYVGITRARKRLYLTFNHSRSPWVDSNPQMSSGSTLLEVAKCEFMLAFAQKPEGVMYQAMEPVGRDGVEPEIEY
ncbi:hypothetical protein GOP47_0005196 [Adiantum capillus-veneris]|uniref:DNA 3'-5' helicase n=1 Tax=Adiantum capillus-veneris TaxID=13818 RepID=A0A9D4ZN06_ADICA|nr:hypothetical protein GOP47_0005196 [Adiantum capillus-veneris]